VVALGFTMGHWADSVVRVVDLLGSTGAALRFCFDVAAPVVSALRVHIALACALLAVPMLVALSRLMPAPATETA